MKRYTHDLPDGVGRPPRPDELGEYGQFFFEPHALPKMYRVKNADDFIHFFQDSGYIEGKLANMPTLQKTHFTQLCSGRPKFSTSVYRFIDMLIIKREIKKSINLMAEIFQGRRKTIGITVIIILSLLVAGLFKIGGIEQSVKPILALFLAFGSLSATAIGVFLTFYKGKFSEHLTQWNQWEYTGRISFESAITSCRQANSANLQSWFNTYNGENIDISGPEHKTGMAIALEQFAGTENGLDREVVFPFGGLGPDIAKPAQTLSTEHRRVLAKLRVEKLWDNVRIKESYIQWLNWDQETAQKHHFKDIELTSGWLKNHLTKVIKRDLELNLSRVIPNRTEMKEYLNNMIQDALFWLQRPVEVAGKKSSFLVWLNKEIADWDEQILYLKSEAAMGKSTTINLLTYAGCRGMLDQHNVIPLRVKIREIENKIKELNEMNDSDFIRTILENLGEWSQLSNALEILNSPKNNDRPILLLDGLDEIKQENQRILLDRLNRLTKMDFPVLVTSRPTRLISPDLQTNGVHATLGRLSPAQRMKILQNIELPPNSLKSMEMNLPPALINRPFALMIAAGLLNDSHGSTGLSDKMNNLSIQRICEVYLEKFDAREDAKKPHTDSTQVRNARISGLQSVGRHQIKTLCETKHSENFLIDETVEIDLMDRTQIHRNGNLVDTWLEGYYAVSHDSFSQEDWREILNHVDVQGGRRSLILRNYCSSSPAPMTLKWNELGSQAPEVIAIVSEEWQAMDVENRVLIMERFDIPHDQFGNIDFSPDKEELLLKCKLAELLSLLHLHCSIADSSQWADGTRDYQWEMLFSKFTHRLKEVPHIATKIDKFKFQFWEDSVIPELFGPDVAKFVKKLIPFDGSPHRHDRLSSFCGDKNPLSLFCVIAEQIEKRGDQSNIFYAIRLIEHFSNQTLFSISLDILDAFFGEGKRTLTPDFKELIWSLAGVDDETNLQNVGIDSWNKTISGFRSMVTNFDKTSPKEFFAHFSQTFKHVGKSSPAMKLKLKIENVIYFRRLYSPTLSHHLSRVEGNKTCMILPSISPYNHWIDSKKCRYGIMIEPQTALRDNFSTPKKWIDIFNNTDLPRSNLEIGEIIVRFENKSAQKFQPTSYIEKVADELTQVKKIGQVTGYLLSSQRKSWSREHRWMIIPGLESTKIGGLAIESISPSINTIQGIFNEVDLNSSRGGDESLSRWYAFDVIIKQNQDNRWVFEPEPSSIQLVCQICLEGEINPSDNASLACHECVKIID
tara:strand:- start:6003 stop:9743 length:3741 start_codon:yes stop_codon:yes gene_type:complete